MSVITFKFNDNEITFDFSDENLKVNATQMAKAFDKHLPHFMENESTEKFIQACLVSRNSDLLGIKNREDLVNSVKGLGTWMHRILALKFAAWLDPEFELWVYSTIDKIIFGDYHNLKKNLKETAERRLKMEKLKDELRAENENYILLEELESEERLAANQRTKFTKSQMDIFKEVK